MQWIHLEGSLLPARIFSENFGSAMRERHKDMYSAELLLMMSSMVRLSVIPPTTKTGIFSLRLISLALSNGRPQEPLDAPCHNNYGEFLIRIGVLKRKVSGGSVSAECANAYAILLSIYVTCRLRGISFLKYMKESLRHYIRTGKPMLLSTYSNFIAESSSLKMAA